MKKAKEPYFYGQICSGVLMIVTLLWLTVSTPFVYAGQQAKKECSKNQSDKKTGADSNPFSNTTEEKNQNVNTISEYLHDKNNMEEWPVLTMNEFEPHSTALYLVFHPELISPPPES